MGMIMRVLVLVFGFQLLTACMNSEVSRDVSTQINQGYRQTYYTMSHLDEGAEFSSSHMRQGALFGSATGAVTGIIYPSVGLLPGTAAGFIIGASYGAYLDHYTTLIDRLQARGVTLVVLGDQVLLVVPTRVLFEGGTPVYRANARHTLYLITQYLNSLLHMSIRVTGYSTHFGNGASSMELSRKQAHMVERTLWSMGVNTRLLYAEGRGANNFIDDATPDCTDNDNNRIEIRLEKLPG